MRLHGLDPGLVLTLISPDGFLAVRSVEVFQIARRTERAKAALVTLASGETFKTTQTFEILRDRLSSFDFVQVQKHVLLNLNLVRKVSKAADGAYSASGPPGLPSVAVNSAFAPEVCRWFGLKTLAHIDPYDRPTYWLMKENIRPFDKQITRMTKEELLANFSDSSGQAVISLMMANFLYQFADWIRRGLAEPLIGGNVRSLWYLIKPAVSRIGALGGKHDHYKTLSEVMARLVKHKVITYREYGLVDDTDWLIGTTNPHVILLAEKRAYFTFAKTLRDQYGVTIIATGGIPGMSSIENFAAALRKAIPKPHLKTIPVIALTDYDPAGDILVEAFQDGLKVYNIRKTIFLRLVEPADFTPEELEDYKYNFEPKNDAEKTKIKTWLKQTGGINGEAFGLEANALLITPNKVRQLFFEKAKPYLAA